MKTNMDNIGIKYKIRKIKQESETSSRQGSQELGVLYEKKYIAFLSIEHKP